jgi:hypothetical protein
MERRNSTTLSTLAGRLAMRGLVIRVRAEEFVPPHRHVARAMAAQVGLAIHDPEDLVRGECAATARGDQREIRYRHLEDRRHGSVATRAQPMAGRTGFLVEMTA